MHLIYSINGILCNGVIPKEDFCLSCNHGENGAAIDGSLRKKRYYVLYANIV